MKAGDLYDLFRSDVSDVAAPYLWSDTEVYAYMNDAYFMFVRNTFGVSDVTSSITEVSVTAGEKYSDLDSRILKIRSAKLVTANRPLKIFNLSDDTPPVNDYGIKWYNSGDENTVGQVRYMVIGEEDDLCRWVQIPDADDTVQLSVFRLPLNEISGPSDEFKDIRSQHHFHLLKWMKHLAYAKQDAETFNKEKSEAMKAEFEEYCTKAWREMERQRAKVRVVKYGGMP